jgi:general secretion pathway protein D
LGLLLAILLTASLQALPALGQIPAAPGSSADDNNVTLNMRDANIRAVVHWLGNMTGKKFVIDPRVKGNMTIFAKEPLSIEDAYHVVVEAMRVYGYSAVESNGVVRIVPDIRAKTLPFDLSTVLDGDTETDMASYVVRLQNLPASELLSQLKPLVPPSGHIVAASPNTLLLIDAKDNVKRLAKLAEHIDTEGSMEFDIIPLQSAPANSMKEVLQGLFAKDKQQLTIAADERSNTLLVSGSSALRRQLRQMANSLDKPESADADTRVFYLHYLTAKELLPVLRGVTQNIQQEQEGKTRSSAQVSIEALEAANAIVVNGPTRFVDEIAKVIEQTDFRRKQVLVDAIIVEVSDDFAREIGVQWKTAFTDTTSGVVASSNFGLVTMDTDGNSILGQGLSLGFMQAGDLRLLLKAVAVNVDANILSRPSIVTLDNEEAEILVGQNIPLITGQATGPASSTSNPFTTVERKDIGITLKVTPQINEGDAITLDVIQEVENVSATASSEATDTVTNKRSVKTKVLVRDQDVLVLGGLIDTTDQTTVKKVPLLGDIPLVGSLFKTTKTEKLRRNLMVFIRPTILADAESASRVSQQRYDTTRNSQQQYYDKPKRKPEPVLLPEFETISPNARSGRKIP